MLNKKINNLKEALSSLLKRLKIKKGDNIILHSNSAGLFQFKQNKSVFDIFYKVLLKKIGRNGSVVIPTYNYMFPRSRLFNYLNSKSVVGNLSNFFLKKFPNRRTTNPIFSHILIGKSLDFLLKIIDYEILGAKSIFSFFEKKNYKIFCFCCSPSDITFLHYLEKKNNVKYRFDKTFSGKVRYKSETMKIKIKYFVGKKKIDYSIKDKNLVNLVDNKNFIEENFGRFSCYSVNTVYLNNILKKKLKTNSSFLISK